MRSIAAVLALLVSAQCYAGFNLKKFVNKHIVPVFVPPSPPPPPPPPPPQQQGGFSGQGFWAGPNGDGGCMLHGQMNSGRKTGERVPRGLEDVFEGDLGPDILDLIFDWDRAHKRFGKRTFNLHVWKTEPFDLNDCGRYFKEFQADMNQLNRMKDAELYAMGGIQAIEAAAAAPLIVGGSIVVGLPALAASAFVAFKKWTVKKTADRNMENFNKCVDMQKKKLEELQEKARRKIEEIEQRKKHEEENEKDEIEDIEV